MQEKGTQMEDELKQLYKELYLLYKLFEEEYIDEEEYCIRVAPLDSRIAEIEMAILLDTPVWRGSS